MTATAAIGSVGGWARDADAALMIDLRSAGYSLDGGLTVHPLFNSKLAVGSRGAITYIEVVARISGSNGVQLLGNFDGAAPADTRNDDGIQMIAGSFRSAGPMTCNWDPSNFGPGGADGVAGSANQFKGPAGPMTLTPFDGPGSTNGTLSDWDSDGDLDIGNAGTDTTSMWRARSSTAVFAVASHKSGSDSNGYWTGGTSYAQDTGGPNARLPQTRINDATTSEIRLAEFAVVVTGQSGIASLNFVPRSVADGTSATWVEDGVTVTPATGQFLLGTPIVFPIDGEPPPFPEPCGASLIGAAAGAGAVTRRRKIATPRRGSSVA